MQREIPNNKHGDYNILSKAADKSYQVTGKMVAEVDALGPASGGVARHCVGFLLVDQRTHQWHVPPLKGVDQHQRV